MTEEQEALIEKARKSLHAARLLLSNNMPDFAASRAYYTMFYVASALLLEKGLKFSKHGSLIAAFGQHFVKTGEIEAKFHRRMIDAQDNRIIGDYSSISNLTDAQAATIISQAEELLALAEQMLGAQPPAKDQSET
jgi:uncharacterized protein (UPF0332 family)